MQCNAVQWNEIGSLCGASEAQATRMGRSFVWPSVALVDPPPLPSTAPLCSLQSLMWCPGCPQLKQTGAPPSSLNSGAPDREQTAQSETSRDVWCVSSAVRSFRPLPLPHAAPCPCSCPRGDLRLAMAAGGRERREQRMGGRNRKKQTIGQFNQSPCSLERSRLGLVSDGLLDHARFVR